MTASGREPEPAVRHLRVADPAFPRRWLLQTLAGAVAAAVPLVVHQPAAVYVGLAGVVVLLLNGLFWLLGGGGSSVGFDGRLLTTRTVRGMKEVDLDRLLVVDGRQLRNQHGSRDHLTLRDDTGAMVELVAAPGFPVGTDTASGTLHVVHRAVRARVEADRVRYVTPGGYAVLGLPPGPTGGKPPRPRGSVGALLLLLAMVPALLGYTELVQALHG